MTNNDDPFATPTGPATATPQPADGGDGGDLLDRENLLILARHWYKVYLGDLVFCFLYAYGPDKSRYDAADRLNRVEALLGPEGIREAVDAVEAEERERLGGEAWRIFRHGSSAERDRVADEIYRDIEYLDAKAADEATCRAAFEYLREHPAETFLDPAGDLWHLAEAPSRDDSTPGHLVLKVRTRRGGRKCARDYRLDRPPGWSAPFGLR